MLYIGMMSGTSANGIDGALVELADEVFQVAAVRSGGYSPGVRESIESIIHSYPRVEKDEIERVDLALAADFARLAKELIEAAGTEPISAIGSHGQTIYHGPGDSPPVTIQIGNPQAIADLTGVKTIGDFRSGDMRAGGQGAPLAPAFHNAMFRSAEADRAVINIGGIANVTALPADRRRPVLGFDTGPGNTLMDQWCREHTGEAFDAAGRWARRGHAPAAFVDALLSDPYFDAPAPKSTGREYFHLDWMKSRYPRWQMEEPVDIQAGLLEVTARSIAGSLDGIGGLTGSELYVCGGGTKNERLMSRLGELAAGPVLTTEALGLPPEWVESCAFAWLAYRREHGLPGNLPTVTGAVREVLLGEIYEPAENGRARPDA